MHLPVRAEEGRDVTALARLTRWLFGVTAPLPDRTVCQKKKDGS